MASKEKWFEKFAFFQKLKNVKHIEIIIAIIFAIVILLIYTSSFNSSKFFNSDDTKFTDLELRLCKVLSDIDGAGNVSVLINYSSDGKEIIGVLVVASGAKETRVRLDMFRAIETVLNVPTSQIEILVGNNK